MMDGSNRSYFGQVDASAEDASVLRRQFVAGKAFDNVIGPAAPDGAEIIVGMKGTGKTALGRVTLEHFEGIKWFRSERSRDSRFEIPDNKLRSGVLMGMIKVFIIEQFIEQLLRDGIIKKTDFDKCATFFKKMGTKFAKATEINAGLIKFKPSDFFSIENQEHFDAAWDSAVRFLAQSLAERQSFIVLDDVDTYFVGLEDHPRFIEGLCRAVNEINKISEVKIYCVLLLKQGVWRTLFERPEEYDKIKHTMEFLSWDLLGCTSVLCGRIASVHGRDILPINKFEDTFELLKLEFHGSDTRIKDCIVEIFSFSANGPRDMIDLCNNIRRSYKSEKITKEMVLERVSNFSEERLYGLNADFGHIYPDIPQFIQSVFQGFKPQFNGTELSERLERDVLTDPRSERQVFGRHDWFKDSTANSLVKKLFDIGVIGIVRPGREALFANENNTISQNSLLRSELLVHRAYQPALGFI
jgi:hypothetical protein